MLLTLPFSSITLAQLSQNIVDFPVLSHFIFNGKWCSTTKLSVRVFFFMSQSIMLTALQISRHTVIKSTWNPNGPYLLPGCSWSNSKGKKKNL